MSGDRTARGALLVATLLGVATIALSSLTVFDFWWYLASGQRILETRSVPATDPFSYTAEGRPWINHMWATQVLFTLLWGHWGRLALIGLKTVTVVATFGVVLGTMRARGVHPLLASGVTLLAAWTGAEFWHARPQTFTYLFVAVLLWFLRPGWERRPATLILVPALVVPWVNLHAGFVMAFLVIGVAGLGTALPLVVDPARRHTGWRVIGLTAYLGVAAAAASLLNPFGARAILFPLEVVRSVPFMTSTIEWFPPNFHHASFRPFELMLLLLFPAFAWGRGRLSAADVGLVLAFANLGLTSVRHVPLFAVVAAAPLAVALEGAMAEWRRVDWAEIRGAVRRRLPSLAPALTAPGMPVMAGAVLLLTAVSAHWAGIARVPTNPLRLDLQESRYPERTMTFIRENRLPHQLFSVYAWGGYGSGGCIPSTGCSWMAARTCTGPTCSGSSWTSSTSARVGRPCWTSGRCRRSWRCARRRSARRSWPRAVGDWSSPSARPLSSSARPTPTGRSWRGWRACPARTSSTIAWRLPIGAPDPPSGMRGPGLGTPRRGNPVTARGAARHRSARGRERRR